MTQPPESMQTTTTVATRPDAAKEMRRLLHDMNNALEVIIQASYLVGTLNLSDDGRQWLKLLDSGVHQCADINKQLRDLIIASQLG